MDPLANKYPGWSTYNYTMNNPIRLYDPDGRGVKEAYNKLKEAVKYQFVAGIQAGISFTYGGKGIEARGNLVSRNIYSGDLGSKPVFNDGTTTTGASIKIGLLGASVEKTLSGTKQSVSHQGIYTKITDSNSIKESTSFSVGITAITSESTETRTKDIITGQVESKIEQDTNIECNKDINLGAVLGIGLNIQINPRKVTESIKELFK